MTSGRVGRAAPRGGPADFTSALYLGLRHPHGALAPWASLTTGAPAALREAPAARLLSRRLGALLGLEAALVAPSTLHLFHDLPDALLGSGSVLLADDGLYPVGRSALERAAARGIRVRFFRHHDPDALADAVRGTSRPVVLTDGWCVACGRYAPLVDYARAVTSRGGVLVIDDTQGLGVFGTPDGTVYGRGGGGAARHLPRLRSSPLRDRVIVVASMAKAFGAPLAFVAGPAWAVRRFRLRGPSREHSSPASAASVASGLRALSVNDARGDELRTRLAANVAFFRQRATEGRLRPAGGPFPVQRVPLPHGIRPEAGMCQLARRGVRVPVLRGPSGPELAFVLRATHSELAVAAALRALDLSVRERAARHAA